MESFDKFALSKEGSRMEPSLTEQYLDLKSFNIGARIRNPDYTPGVDFLDHDFL